jgi:hypothetical protein
VAPALVSALVFSTTGFFIGKAQRAASSVERLQTAQPEIPPMPPADPAPKPAEPTPPLPEPPKSTENPSPPPQPTQEKLSADAALKAFLDAPDWKTRVELVIFPDDMRASMEARATELGDGPIATTSVALVDIAKGTHIYKVCTSAIPEGFPVAVVETEDGAKVNWESFVNFHDDLFRKFIEGPPGKTGVFHVLVKPEPLAAGEAESHFVRYRLSVPMPKREQLAWMRKDSVALARLRGIFEGSGKMEKPVVDKLAATDGIPLVLSLAKREANDGQKFIEITDLVGLGWGPSPE